MTGKPRLTGKRSGTPDVSDPDGAGEAYRVGPGRPPREFQFKPGQSGNPKGARRKGASVVPDLKAVLERALSKTVTLRQGEKERVVTMATAGIEQLVGQYAKGDRYARRDVFDLAQRLGVDLAAGRENVIEQALATDVAAEDEALLADYLRRHGARAIDGDRRSSSAGNARRRRREKVK
jgi:hypothetical protein